MDNTKERLCVVMPVYNEEEAIAAVLLKWDSMLKTLGVDYEIRPYNDGSKDDSLAVMRKVALGAERINVRSKPNGGHGNTILTGYREAVADGFDWVFQVDSDDEMGPEKFGELWANRHGYDFLVGRRDGRRQAISRKVVSFISRVCVRLFYGKSIWDVNTPYRLMRISAFARFFEKVPPNTFAPNVILSGMAARYGLRCFEIPVPQHDRATGEVSIKQWSLFKAAVKSFCQTIWFARDSVPILALIPVAISFVALDLTTFMWYDELAMCDGVFMKALHGLDWSGVWACSYNPLYPLSLVAWVKIFGASHFSVCSFTVLMGYLATVVIASIAHRRGLWRGVLSDVAFVFLFWGGWHFAWILSNARVDVLVLLLATLFADSLTGNKDGKPHLWAVFGWAMLLFLAAPYTLPLLFFYGIFLLVVGEESRTVLVKRGFAAAAGFGVGFLITAIYYLIQRDIIRLLGSYIYFNSITGYVPAPFWERVLTGYLFDVLALVWLVVAFAVGALSRKVRPYAVFVALIPLLMVVGGRYETYYAWVFYVPTVVLLLASIKRKSRMALIAFAAVGAVSCVIRPVMLYINSSESRANRAACRNFVERNAKRFSRGMDVVVASDLGGNTGFYYPLVGKGVRIWYRGPEMLSGRTDAEKFNEGLARLPLCDERMADVRLFIAKVQRFMPLLPRDGLVMFYSKDDLHNIKPMLEAKGCNLDLLDEENGYSLWRFEQL